MKQGTVRNILFIYFFCISAIIGCMPPPEQEEDHLALSLANTTSPSAQGNPPEESKTPPPAFQGMFQANNTDPAVLSISPHQLFVCKRNQDVITVALYYYYPTENNMICSFLSYKRTYKQEEGRFIESNSHTAAPFDKDCRERAEEKLNTTAALKGWKCKETPISTPI